MKSKSKLSFIQRKKNLIQEIEHQKQIKLAADK